MQGNRFAVSLHLHGTLAANARGEFKVPTSCTFEAVSVSASTATNATLEIGTGADRDGILDAVAVGVSGTPNFYDAADFNGALATPGQPYPFAKEAIFAWDLDFDGAAGTAAANCELIFFFLE